MREARSEPIVGNKQGCSPRVKQKKAYLIHLYTADGRQNDAPARDSLCASRAGMRK